MKLNLIEKFHTILDTLNDAELDNYKSLLAIAVGELAPNSNIPETFC